MTGRTSDRGVSDATTEAASDATTEAAPSTWLSVARSAGTRALILPVSAAVGVLNTRLIIENYGKPAYAQFALLVSVAALIPFTDLGMSAAIMNAIGGSEQPASDQHVRRVITTCVRVLSLSAAVVLGVTAIISVLGWWPAIMGSGLLEGTGPLVAAGCLVLIALALPISFGQRVLTGLGRNHVTVAMLGLQTPIVLVVLLVLTRSGDGTGAYLPWIPYAVSIGLAATITLLAARAIRPAIGRALRDVPRRRAVPGTRVFDVGGPALVQMIAIPLAMQSDRLVLSHVGDTATLATYNLSSQMYIPVWQVTTAAGVALWPIFARARARGTSGAHSPVPLSAGFGAGAFAACLAISIASPWLAELASDGQITIPLSMQIAFSTLMVLQAVKYPLGTFMTDAAGLRFQAFMIVPMLPVNLAISLVLANRYGAVGPVIGSAIGVLMFQVVPNYAYVRWNLGSRSRSAGAASS
jgi:O-antigen/teichoic acid export membrane protein